MNVSWLMSLYRSIDNGINEIASQRCSNVAPSRGSSRAPQVVIQQNPCNNNAEKRLKKGTWNVRTMNRPGKLENIKNEMKRLSIDILGLSEVRWREKGDFEDGDTKVIYSGETGLREEWLYSLEEE